MSRGGYTLTHFYVILTSYDWTNYCNYNLNNILGILQRNRNSVYIDEQNKAEDNGRRWK